MKAEEKIIRAFHDTKGDRLYFSEIKEHTKLSNSSTQNALKYLVNEKMLEKHATKANAFYSITDKEKKALEFSRIDLDRFESLNRNIRMPLKEFLVKAPREIVSILLFGSSARLKETEKSDIDLLIILHKFKDEKFQKAYENETTLQIEKIKKEVEARSVHNISLAFVNIENFKKNNDHLVSQAKENGFPIFNQQLYYEAIRNEY